MSKRGSRCSKRKCLISSTTFRSLPNRAKGGSTAFWSRLSRTDSANTNTSSLSSMLLWIVNDVMNKSPLRQRTTQHSCEVSVSFLCGYCKSCCARTEIRLFQLTGSLQSGGLVARRRLSSAKEGSGSCLSCCTSAIGSTGLSFPVKFVLYVVLSINLCNTRKYEINTFQCKLCKTSSLQSPYTLALRSPTTPDGGAVQLAEYVW